MNYLPSDSQLKKSVVMMCEQAGGIGNGMNYRFIRVETRARLLAEPITSEEALGLLRTNPEDNARKPDNAQLDRSVMEKLAISMAGMRAASKASGKFTPRKNEMEPLALLQKQLGVKQLRKALAPVQSLVQAKQRYDALMSRLRKEARCPEDLPRWKSVNSCCPIGVPSLGTSTRMATKMAANGAPSWPACLSIYDGVATGSASVYNP